MSKRWEETLNDQRWEWTEYVLPSHWASALVNDDPSGLSEEEYEELCQWERRGQPGWCVDVGENEFSWHNDANDLGGDVATFTFQRAKREPTNWELHDDHGVKPSDFV